MFSPDQYSLLDFGNGRKLERFGDLLVDRTSPTADSFTPKSPDLWKKADLRFLPDPDERGTTGRGNAGAGPVQTEGRREGAKRNREEKGLGHRGRWIPLTKKGEPFASGGSWFVRHRCGDESEFTLELKGSPFGHLGIFPEQSVNWDALYRLCREGSGRLGRPLRVLNLFAYTGGSSLACAVAGAEVTHLDAAQNIVRQARRNAESSALTDAPIRWITDDAGKFVRREGKRGNFYDGVILDPPTYGHGARGEVWRLGRDLPRLLDDLFPILDPKFPFILLTCHSPGFGVPELTGLLRERVRERWPERRFHWEPLSMTIPSETGARLSAGERVFFHS